ncbi:MAG: magnesium chelatase subunit H [Pseudomonadota bacterium]
MRKPTSAAEQAPAVRVVIVTMDNHLASATARAAARLRRELPGLHLVMHTAAEWGCDAAALARCIEDIERADIVVNTMLFMHDHIQAVLPALTARRPHCDAMVGCMSAGEVARLTRLGRFDMSAKESAAVAFLKKLRPKPKEGEAQSASSGARQMRMLRRLPKILRFIPGTAQDVRAYFLTLQYWLCGSEDNVVNMVRMLIDRYADGPRRALRGTLACEPPREYPEVGLYHPRLPGRIGEDVARLPRGGTRGTIGVLLMRSYPLAKNTGHYDGVLRALEARGLDVVPAFSSGLDARPAVEKFFVRDGRPLVDAVVSLTGFSLVGGPAYNDARSAEQMLAELDVPYIAAHPVEFQTLEQWAASERGLMPVESTIMVAIPELDGSTGPLVYGGRSDGAGKPCRGCTRACVFPPAVAGRDMQSCGERADMLAARVDRLVALRRAERRQRKVAVVLFNFPPNAGNTGTAAHLGVFESLHRTLVALDREGYAVEVPSSPDALRQAITGGNAQRLGAAANVHASIAVDDHVRREPWLAEIEAAWGPAPGRQQTDGRAIHVLGARFGNVFVGVQPGFGYEGDPMRLLFEKGFAPTHAFSAFYRWIREDFGAHAVLHFGTHGALEFMPGKQVGMSGSCWPERLLGDLPNIYLYAANNPSEGAIAKRRAQATLVSYLTPPVAEAGLYRGLNDLKVSIDRWMARDPSDAGDDPTLAQLIQAQAAVVDLAAAEPPWADAAGREITRLKAAVAEVEHALIPHGLHVVGAPPGEAERVDLLAAHADAAHGRRLPREAIAALVAGQPAQAAAFAGGIGGESGAVPLLEELARVDALLREDHELPAILRALDGRYIRPSPGGDLIRTPAVLPTGRNIHGFDPFRIPSAWALADGARQAQRLLDRYLADAAALPESVALVLWGTDNLKSEGAPIGQALALMGARPRFDSYGRLCGAELLPLAELGRPRIDVMVSLSGIFRDLLPLQIRLLAEASWLAASAEEPESMNYVRKHALRYAAEHSVPLETAALRVYGNADGAYGANVNHLVEDGRWNDEDELAETYTRRKCFAFDRSGRPSRQSGLLASTLADVDLAYQNLESVEVGVTTISNYFDTLGGISRAARRARGGEAPPVYISDQTRGTGAIRSLAEQVALEARTRVLNPKWYEGMLKHGFEGVRQIEEHVTNTMGWSATTGQVQPWVYQQLAQTFLLDPQMRERLVALNPAASAKVANRLLEAQERRYWQPDDATLEALRSATQDVEDRLEGIHDMVAA